MKRRAFLRSAGVALLLPQMESMGQVPESDSPRRLLTIVRALLANFFTKLIGPSALGHAKAGSFAEVEYAV